MRHSTAVPNSRRRLNLVLSLSLFNLWFPGSVSCSCSASGSDTRLPTRPRATHATDYSRGGFPILTSAYCRHGLPAKHKRALRSHPPLHSGSPFFVSVSRLTSPHPTQLDRDRTGRALALLHLGTALD